MKNNDFQISLAIRVYVPSQKQIEFDENFIDDIENDDQISEKDKSTNNE